MDDLNSFYPKITLETDDIIMTIAVKKDYSSIKNLDDRKIQFIKDLKEFIGEFSETNESSEFMSYYD